MNCYKTGGCGVYENRSCYECPASKPEYLDRNKIRRDKLPPIDMVLIEDEDGNRHPAIVESRNDDGTVTVIMSNKDYKK